MPLPKPSPGAQLTILRPGSDNLLWGQLVIWRAALGNTGPAERSPHPPGGHGNAGRPKLSRASGIADAARQPRKNSAERERAASSHQRPGVRVFEQPCQQRFAFHAARADLRRRVVGHAGSPFTICDRRVAIGGEGPVRAGRPPDSNDERSAATAEQGGAASSGARASKRRNLMDTAGAGAANASASSCGAGISRASSADSASSDC